MSERVTLRMRFRDSNNHIVSFSVSPPLQPVNVNDVGELMDLIISSNAFYTYSEGDVVEKVDALLITVAGETVIEW